MMMKRMLLTVVLVLSGCQTGQPVRIETPVQGGAVMVRVAGPPVLTRSVDPPNMLTIEQRWTNECIEIPRLAGGTRGETELEWVRRIGAAIAERHDRRLVSVSYPLQHRGTDMALVCFTAPHPPYQTAPSDDGAPAT